VTAFREFWGMLGSTLYCPRCLKPQNLN